LAVAGRDKRTSRKEALRRARREDWAGWVRSEADHRALEAGHWFDAAAAERVREFFRKFLRHSKGEWAGKPFELLPWQWEDVVAPLFGWKRPDGLRRFRKAYIEIPKKNGKSTLAAGLALYLLVADGEPGAEIYSAAADRDQASIVFNEAALMVRASPGLKGRALVTDSRKQIGWPLSNSYYKALSADVPTKEGLNWHGLLFDELHAQRTRRLWDALMYGGIARRQPLSVAITTAGYDRESICYEQHEYARRVTEGQVRDLSFLPVLYAAGAKDDWTKSKAWRKANPSMGVIFSEASLARDCQEARESPRKENAFRQRRLNQWTEQAERWLVMEKWDACGGEADAGALAGRPCYAGLDLSSTTDLTALVLLFPPAEEEKGWSVLAFFWAPETGARKREDRDGVPYLTWAKEGLVELTPGEIVDYDRIRTRINALGERYKICEIALDRWNATQLATQLDGDGFTVVPFGQGYASMSGPSKELEKRILAGELAHGGNPVMRWMAANAAVERDAADNIKPSKKKSTERIDGIVALVMATGREMVQGAGEDKKSIYEERGVLLI